MKLVRVARNVILAGIAWRLIALQRDALARERRARRIAPLLIVAVGTGAIWVARPRILAGARRLWDAAQRRLNRQTEANVHGESQPDAEKPQRASELHAPPGESLPH